MNEQETRARLEAERERLLDVRSAATRLTASAITAETDAGARPDSPPSERVGGTIERELDQTVIDQAEMDLVEIGEALERLSAGAYGRCEECGKPIAEARLEARPAARYCVEDQAKVEKSR